MVISFVFSENSPLFQFFQFFQSYKAEATFIRMTLSESVDHSFTSGRRGNFIIPAKKR
jgi:hypothetical protein